MVGDIPGPSGGRTPTTFIRSRPASRPERAGLPVPLPRAEAGAPSGAPGGATKQDGLCPPMCASGSEARGHTFPLADEAPGSRDAEPGADVLVSELVGDLAALGQPVGGIDRGRVPQPRQLV